MALRAQQRHERRAVADARSHRHPPTHLNPLLLHHAQLLQSVGVLRVGDVTDVLRVRKGGGGSAWGGECEPACPTARAWRRQRAPTRPHPTPPRCVRIHTHTPHLKNLERVDGLARTLVLSPLRRTALALRGPRDERVGDAQRPAAAVPPPRTQRAPHRGPARVPPLLHQWRGVDEAAVHRPSPIDPPALLPGLPLGWDRLVGGQQRVGWKGWVRRESKWLQARPSRQRSARNEVAAGGQRVRGRAKQAYISKGGATLGAWWLVAARRGGAAGAALAAAQGRRRDCPRPRHALGRQQA